jgi:hypothetical protein
LAHVGSWLNAAQHPSGDSGGLATRNPMNTNQKQNGRMAGWEQHYGETVARGVPRMNAGCSASFGESHGV